MRKKNSSATLLQQQALSVVTLREESSGKKRSNVNAKSMLKFDHLKSLAIWAATEASIPSSLAAVFGHRLGATAQALGVPPDPSFFPCQRCESVLQLGHNCTVRIEKIKAKSKPRRCKKPSLSIKNSVVYNCHFCSHRNLKRGTPKDYMKELCPPKVKFPSKSDLTTKSNSKKSAAKSKVITASKDDDGMFKVDGIGIGIASQEITSKDLVHSSPTTTPLTKVGTLLDSNKKKRNSLGSSKRERKSWTSLKDIANEQDSHSSCTFTNLAIPFRM